MTIDVQNKDLNKIVTWHISPQTTNNAKAPGRLLQKQQAAGALQFTHPHAAKLKARSVPFPRPSVGALRTINTNTPAEAGGETLQHQERAAPTTQQPQT